MHVFRIFCFYLQIMQIYLQKQMPVLITLMMLTITIDDCIRVIHDLLKVHVNVVPDVVDIERVLMFGYAFPHDIFHVLE